MAVQQSSLSGGARKARTRLLPNGTGSFFKRRTVEFAGVGVALAGLVVFAACLTYNPADPSANRVGAEAARNLLGQPGAALADVLIQTLGLAAFLLTPVLLVWGWRLIRVHRLHRWWLRLALLPLALLCFAAALATLPPPGGWLPETTLGGSAGRLILGHAGRLLDFSRGISALVALPVGLGLLAYVLGLSMTEWRRLAGGLARLGVGARRGVERGMEAAAQQAETAVAKSVSALEKAKAEGLRLEPILERGPAAAPVEVEPAAALGDERSYAPPASRVEPKKTRVTPGKRGKSAAQRTLDLGATGQGYEVPPLSLMDMPIASAKDASINRDALEKNARLLEGVLEDFGVRGEIVKVMPGPVVTRYELEPAPGTKTSRVVGLADDIARSMSAVSVRVAVVRFDFEAFVAGLLGLRSQHLDHGRLVGERGRLRVVGGPGRRTGIEGPAAVMARVLERRGDDLWLAGERLPADESWGVVAVGKAAGDTVGLTGCLAQMYTPCRATVDRVEP